MIKHKMFIEVSLPTTIFREGKAFVAYSPSLDLSTYGKSFEEARKRFAEAVGIFFEELTERGTLDRVLTGLGWEKQEKNWLPPTLISQEAQSFRIPLQN